MNLKIANPRPGGPKHTCRAQAERFVRRGQAVFIGDSLHFFEDGEQREMATTERRLATRRSPSDIYVHGAFSIAIVDRLSFPHTQWFHGESLCHAAHAKESGSEPTHGTCRIIVQDGIPQVNA